MFRFITSTILIGSLFILSSCVTSMAPTQVVRTLPTLTVSKFISQTQASEALKSNKCKYLVRGRKYNAPMGFTVQADLRNGARGIDEWVKLDGGNAYVLINHNWFPVGNEGATQLFIEFDTLLCED